MVGERDFSFFSQNNLVKIFCFKTRILGCGVKFLNILLFQGGGEICLLPLSGTKIWALIELLS